ncbi:retrovirus-related pol polyprotein from transposon TNT 1-94 [Tanacetum coccineum]
MPPSSSSPPPHAPPTGCDVIRAMETDIVKLMVEIESFGCPKRKVFKKLIDVYLKLFQFHIVDVHVIDREYSSAPKAKLRAQLFDKVSEQKDTTKGTSMNTKFANQSTERKPFLQSLRNKFVVRQPNAFQSERPNFSKTWFPQKVDKMNDLSNPVTSNSVPTTKESKVVENDKVIAPRMFRINPFKNYREEKFVLNKPTKASVRTNLITIPQPHVITKKAANYDSNDFSSTGVDITTKTRRPQPMSNTKNDMVPFASNSSHIKNKEVKVEDHPRNLLLSKNKKHMSYECNNIKLVIRNDKSEIVCAMCKQCLVTANHDSCVLNYVNGMNSCSKKQKANISNIANQTKHKAHIWISKNVGSKERLASPKPSKPRMRLRWSPTRKMFDIKGKLIASSESNGDNACTPNPQEPTIKRFPNSTFSLGRLSKYVCGASTQDLCGLMRIASINGKRYVLVIVDDYSRYTWVVFLRPKDEALEEIKTFLKKIIVLLQAPVIIVLCYPKNDREDIGKLGAKDDIVFFIGYSANSCAYRV